MLCIVSGVKIMEYEQMDKQIIQGVGGKENVKSVIHCATRLRFVLYDESKADDKKIIYF